MDDINKRWLELAEQGYVIEVSPGQVGLIDADWAKQEFDRPPAAYPKPFARPFYTVQTREWQIVLLWVDADAQRRRLQVDYEDEYYESQDL